MPRDDSELERILERLHALDPTIVEAIGDVDRDLVRSTLDMTPLERLRSLESLARIRPNPVGDA